MAFKRLPNGAGTISKLKQNLRNPYRARKLIGISYDEKERKAVYHYKTVGYFPSRKDALDALMRDSGRSTTDEVLTFYALFDRMYAEKEPTIGEGRRRTYLQARKAFFLIGDRPFRDLRVNDYEMILNEQAPTIRGQFRSILNTLYEYAIRHELADKNYAALVNVDTKHDKREKRPFTVAEVAILEKRRGEMVADMALVGLYTGLRPTELCTLETTMITDGCFKCGIKTENGRNRLVPIHPHILPIVEEYARKAAENERTALFVNRRGKQFPERRYGEKLRALFPEHSAHELRHSFITYARRSGMDAIMVKRIVGHSLNDLTEEVYTHVDADLLKAEMAKYRIA